MMKYLLLFLLFALALSKYSYSDECYRYGKKDVSYWHTFYQFYVNKKGIPLSQDYIIYQGSLQNPEPAVKYYYHHVLSNCTKEESTFNCVSTCESIWFKIGNATTAKEFVSECDPIFYKKYGDVMKHKCSSSSGMDPFYYLYQQLGKTTPSIITMEGKVPIAPAGYNPDGECIWEYEILGLWSIVAIIIVSCCVIGTLIFVIIVWFIAQKHRSNKRKRLESSLMHSTEMPSV